MSNFKIRPQEIYLLERYSSAEYFKELVDAFQNMHLSYLCKTCQQIIAIGMFHNSLMW